MEEQELEVLDEKKKKNHIQKSIDLLKASKSGENRLPPIPPKRVELSAKDKAKKRKGKHPRHHDEY